MNNKAIKFIVNPAAGGGKPAKSWQKIKRSISDLFNDFNCAFTAGAGTATALTRDALRSGIKTIVAIGGDGTLNEVANGFFEDGKPLNPDAQLGIISMGTGGDFAKSLRSEIKPKAALLKIKAGKTRACDIGLVTFENQKQIDNPSRRYFLNIADAGFGGALVHQMSNSGKRLGPSIGYLSALIKTLIRYQNIPVQIKVDDAPGEELRVMAVIVANGQFFGGGMWIAPSAKIDDGLFRIVVIGDVSKATVIRNIHKLYSGTLRAHASVKTLIGKKIHITSVDEVLVEADGELTGSLPATFEIMPAALKIIA